MAIFQFAMLVYQRVTSKHNGQRWPKNVTAENHSKSTSDSGIGFSKIDAICAGGFRGLKNFLLEICEYVKYVLHTMWHPPVMFVAV